MEQQRRVALAPGVSMPMVGLGTWGLRDTYIAVRTALDAGYRHVDTAAQYGNEDAVGAAVRDSGVPREQVFLTTKILSHHLGTEADVVAASLRHLRTDYLDLWLIHDPPPPGLSEQLWEFMIGLRERGLARAIGVSEYGTGQLDAVAVATGVTPAVNQIRWAPALFDGARVRELRDRGVQLEGFSAVRLTDLDHPVLTRIAQAHGVTATQVVLRWHLDHGVVAIPRSSTAERIRANLDVWDFALTSQDLADIDALSVVGRRPVAAGDLVGRSGTVLAPTGVPTGAGEIEVAGQPALLAWSAQPLPAGTMARIVGQRGPRAVEVVAADARTGTEDTVG